VSEVLNKHVYPKACNKEILFKVGYAVGALIIILNFAIGVTLEVKDDVSNHKVAHFTTIVFPPVSLVVDTLVIFLAFIRICCLFRK